LVLLREKLLCYTIFVTVYLVIDIESEDKMLALKQTIKDISKAKKITQLEMAEVLGISKQNFSNKVQRNTFSPDELAKLADSLGMELVFIDKNADIKNGEKFIISGQE